MNDKTNSPNQPTTQSLDDPSDALLLDCEASIEANVKKTITIKPATMEIINRYCSGKTCSEAVAILAQIAGFHLKVCKQAAPLKDNNQGKSNGKNGLETDTN